MEALIYTIIFMSGLVLFLVCSFIDVECESNIMAIGWVIGILVSIVAYLKMLSLSWSGVML